MKVKVESVSVPAMSTLGYGVGTDTETGQHVRFVGDHRPMRQLGEAIDEADEPVYTELEDWQVQAVWD